MGGPPKFNKDGACVSVSTQPTRHWGGHVFPIASTYRQGYQVEGPGAVLLVADREEDHLQLGTWVEAQVVAREEEGLQIMNIIDGYVNHT